MNFIVKPSLQQMALVKIAIDLWNQKDIRKTLKNYNFPKDVDDFYNEWQEVEEQVVVNVYQLSLHEHLQKDLTGIIRPIGCQIRAWYLYHHPEGLPHQFSWTPEGTIDRKKTAQTSVKDEDIDVRLRYELACVYCLEDQLPELWSKIPKHQKFQFQINNIEMNKLVQFWSCQLVNQLSKLDQVIVKCAGQSNPHVYAFHCAIKGGNVTATEFFFDKLSDEERNTLLVEFALIAAKFSDGSANIEDDYWSKVFQFLLSRMSEDQHKQTLKECYYLNLRFFLDWPNQPFFLSMAEKTMSFITKDDNNAILEFIIYKIICGWTDFDYSQLFLNYWSLIPLDYKRRSLKRFSLVSKLFERGEESILKSIFNDANAIDKEGFILSEEGLNLCVKLAENEKWSLLWWLVGLCGPSKEVMVELKEGLMERLSKNNVSEAKNQRNWCRIFSLFDDFIAKKTKKRKAKDDNCYYAENV